MLLVQVLLILTPMLYECAYSDPYSGKVHKNFNYSTLGRKLRTSDWLTWHEVRHQIYHYLQHFAQWHVWVNVSFEYSPGSFWLSGKNTYMPFIHTALIGHGPHDLQGAWACVSLVLNFLHCFPVFFFFFPLTLYTTQLWLVYLWVAWDLSKMEVFCSWLTMWITVREVLRAFPQLDNAYGWEFGFEVVLKDNGDVPCREY